MNLCLPARARPSWTLNWTHKTFGDRQPTQCRPGGHAGRDTMVCVTLLFGGDRSQSCSARDHIISELASSASGEPLPYATLFCV